MTSKVPPTPRMMAGERFAEHIDGCMDCRLSQSYLCGRAKDLLHQAVMSVERYAPDNVRYAFFRMCYETVLHPQGHCAVNLCQEQPQYRVLNANGQGIAVCCAEHLGDLWERQSTHSIVPVAGGYVFTKGDVHVK